MIEIKEIQIDAKDLNKGSIVADYNESCVMDWSCFDNQADMEYIKECAESVGMDVTDKTAFTIPFIAEVMRKMNNSAETKQIYGRGYKDGQEALAYHLELCKEEGSVIIVSEDATNGDVIKAMFPNAKIIINECLGVHGTVYFEYDKIITFYPLDWWNSPYRKEQE